MGATHVAFGVTSKHPRDLRDPFGAEEHCNVGGGNAASGSFGDENMVVGAGSNLGKMSNREYLVVRCYASQCIPYH